MATNQALEYAPQCGDLIVESVFWCTAIAYDPNSPADNSEVRPLKEYKIKVTMMNDKNPLTLDFKTFIETTGQFYSAVDSLLSHHWDKAEFLGAEYTKDEKFRSFPNVLSNSNFTKDPSKVTDIELTALMIAVNNGEMISPLIRDSPSTVPDEGTGKTTPLSEGPREDKDSERLKSLTDMQSQTPPITSLLGANAEDQADNQTLLLTTTVDVQALLLSDDESPKPSKESSTEVPTKEPVSQEHQSHTPHKEIHESFKALKTDASDSESSSCSESLKSYDNYMPITERQLASNLKNVSEVIYAQYENNDVALRNFQQILNLFKTDHNTRLKRILKNLKEVQAAVKEDHALNKKVLEAIEAYT
ncbi:hypothetical protein Tco_0976382 [Tanacetum coccineum]|uniref:Uncharacterized protein n=1 Tax=Tanacetum coccineum TaxID=301880 RepID=A0ABQ5EH55_9ASTR